MKAKGTEQLKGLREIPSFMPVGGKTKGGALRALEKGVIDLQKEEVRTPSNQKKTGAKR